MTGDERWSLPVIIPPSRRLERRTEEHHNSAPSLLIRPHNQHDLKEMRRVDRRHQTMRQTKLATTLAALGSVAVLALTGCSSEAADDSNTNDPPARDIQAEREAAEGATTTETAQSSVEDFAVGEPFGDAAWAVKFEDATAEVNIRSDRLIVYTSNTIRAYTPDGKEDWSREVPGDTEVWVLDETVATLEEVTSEGSGLDQDQTAERITLLSQKDGSVVAEKDVARHSTSVDRYGVIVFGSQDVFDDEQSALTEDGRTIDHEPQDSDSEGGPVSVGGTPIDPSLKPSTAFLANILAIDRKQGLSVLELTPLPYGESAPPIYVVDTKTGQVVYELQCPDLLSTGEMIARNSPNGRYGVAGPFWMSGTEGKCFGGGDGQKTIEFSAVDDNGTAYGETDEGELVVITKGGEPEVSDAPVPIGVMDGNIAIHIDGEKGAGFWFDSTITANPIK
ncbi:hypothetical protein [Candidatus Neomicrothrix sp.]|uniref:hypothetical protein n=1 Tax=Candidatus Neomicrothrix sp. TaxID=2719034 RepID=UPI0025961677|nr:hypothetical protein [Candidatus Microthrix sp.]HMS48847.1 hypothetical protein [Candidatus Microthrix sp.]